jgi:DNA-binding XRE family transcriptional regulator
MKRVRSGTTRGALAELGRPPLCRIVRMRITACCDYGRGRSRPNGGDAVADSEIVAQARVALGRQLAASRRAAGLSQEQLAPLSGHSRSTVANAETGRQRAPRDFWKLCDAALVTGTTALARLAERHRQSQPANRRNHLPAFRHGLRRLPPPPPACQTARSPGPSPPHAAPGQETSLLKYLLAGEPPIRRQMNAASSVGHLSRRLQIGRVLQRDAIAS